MPFTRPLDAVHSVTIQSSQRGYRSWQAQGDIFVTSGCVDIGVTVEAEGKTMIEAEDRAFSAARNRCPRR